MISANLLGGCSGTTGPLSSNPATETPYCLDFPLLHMSDLVAVHRRLIAELGIARLHGAVGGSLGGMQVLQWVIDDPEAIDRAVVIAASSRISPENIAFSAAGREAIMSDPDFCNGHYVEQGVFPWRGQKVARMMAHITYVSPPSLAFNHWRRSSGPSRGSQDRNRTAGVSNSMRYFSRLPAASWFSTVAPSQTLEGSS